MSTLASDVIAQARTETNDSTRWNDATMLVWLNRALAHMLFHRQDLRTQADGSLLAYPPTTLALIDDWPLDVEFTTAATYYIAFNYFRSDSENVKMIERSEDFRKLFSDLMGFDVK